MLKRGWLAILAASVLGAFSARYAAAQLPAFPGAEGAGKYSAGGRGGQVYHVTNLNDSGAGSLRQIFKDLDGEYTTPTTVVFDVSGDIHLLTDLDVKRTAFLTIAGQTAPGDGITLVGRQMKIVSSHDVVVQHLRIRPGTEVSQAPGSSYRPDGLWIKEGADTVIVDHVDAGWSTDENLSITNGATNITVQWSVVHQGIHMGGTTTEDHSFGSLINAGDVTMHHNLYAHNRSRNIRPQSGDSFANYDFVNNVIYNPGDRYTYSETSASTNAYHLNFVNNFGIDGPNSTAPSLVNSLSTASQIYAPAGSMLDGNNDGLLDSTPASGGNFVTGTSTTLATRVTGSSNNLYPVTTTTADQAYIQVVSRAGATYARDPINRRLIRTVLNQTSGHLTSNESEWGGYPPLASPARAPDTNNDGVPDSWAADHGFGVSTPLNSTFAPDGYTYLEKYIQSLTPYAYAPVGTQSHAIKTSFGRGADAQVDENGGASASSGGSGNGATLDVAWDGSGGTTNQAILLKFDLSQVTPGSLAGARLDLTAAADIVGTRKFKLYGIEHDASGWDWSESSIDFDNAPGLAFDGNSQTLGIDPTYNAAMPADIPDVLALGTVTVGPTSAGNTVSFSNPNLAVFLNLAAYFQDQPQENLVTIVLEQITSAAPASFHSKEGNAAMAPRLVVDGLLEFETPAGLPGDYNGDHVVNAADYTVWRNLLGTNTMLTNETESLGIVDEADYDAWKANFGNTDLPGSGAGGAGTVPEPAALWLLASAAGELAAVLRRRHS
jgi:hypothetical protein